MNDLETLTATASIVDLALVLGLVVAVIVGVFRGLVAQVMALAGWLVAYAASQAWGPGLGPLLPVGEPGSRTQALAGMMVAFVGTLVAWALLTWLVSQMVKASPLSALNRTLGAVFGALQFGVISLLVHTIFSLTPLGAWEPWETSRAAPVLGRTLEMLRPVLPKKLLDHLPPAAPVVSQALY